MTDSEKIKVSIVHFEKDVVDWYQWANNRRKFDTSADLKAHYLNDSVLHKTFDGLISKDKTRR